MALTIVNQTTARAAENAVKEGRQVLIVLREAFGTIPAGSVIDLGLFPTDEKIAVTTDIQRTSVFAQNPEGGADVLLTEDVTQVSATYDSIPVLTPDDTVRALHAGSTPTAMTGTLAGATVSPFAPGMSIPVSQIVVRRHPGANAQRMQRIFWHPRVGLQSAGEGDNSGKETLIFRSVVQTIDKALIVNPALVGYLEHIGVMGAVFNVPNDKLTTVLEILAEAEQA
jgi:hypothetical protein